MKCEHILVVSVVVLLLICPFVIQAQEMVERDVDGWGFSEREAVLDALHEATFQICDIRIELQTDTELLHGEGNKHTTTIEFINRHIQAHGEGKRCGFDGYDVLSADVHDSHAHAVVRVRYSVY